MAERAVAPSVHVARRDASAALERQVVVGAEEEGVPVGAVAWQGEDPVAAAYAAARSSVFGVGLAIGAGRIVLHEAHMPPEKPVLDAELGARPESVARRFGGNAARFVARLPFRLADEPENGGPTQAVAPSSAAVANAIDSPPPSAEEVARIVAAVVARLTKGSGLR